MVIFKIDIEGLPLLKPECYPQFATLRTTCSTYTPAFSLPEGTIFMEYGYARVSTTLDRHV
jgi:hypothetical protein